MRWYKSKMILLILAVIAPILFIIYGLFSRIQSQMEKSATESVREIVQIIESGIAELRRNDVDAAMNLANLISGHENTAEQLALLKESSPFSRLSYVAVDSASGLSHNGNLFNPKASSLPGFVSPSEAFVSEVYMSDMGAWTYTVCCPVYNGGKLAGTLYTDVIMERYDNILPDSIFQGKGLIYILDSDTLRFIYEPTSTRVIISGKYDLHGFLNDFGLLDGKLEQDISSAITARENTIVRMWVDGESSYVYFWPVDEGEWYLCGIIPERSIQSESNAVMQTIIITSIIILGAAAVILLLYFWYSRKNQKARQYQIALFDGIAKSIEDVVLLYDCNTGKLELAFDNITRILGIGGKKLSAGTGTMLPEAISHNKQLAVILRPETFQTGTESSQKVDWDNPLTGLKQCLKVETSYVDLTGTRKCIVSILDITKEEQMQESLRTSVLAAQNASRVKSAFLSQMSHEIRTPMNAVVGMVQIAEARLDNRERVSDCLQKIKSSSQHLLNLINDILDISKIESQKMSLSESWFRLNELLTDLNDIISVQAGMRKQQFTIHNQVGDLQLLADRTRLSQVIMNLLNNSIKYTQEGGCVTLYVERSPSTVRDYCLLHFRIQDNGIGMNEKFQKKLFIPFEREDDQAVRSQTGTGLGLAIVQNIVFLMSGSIRVESSKGIGTTFYVDIEFKYKSAEQPVQTAEPVQQTACDLTGIVILLAEDNELNREIATEFLVMANAQVECAVDGADAFEKFRNSEENRYDLILMDMQMPRLDGLETTRQIRHLDRADAKSIPIIAVTANAYFEDEQQCMESGMNDHVAKPLDMQLFYQVVRKYIKNNSHVEGKQ